MKHGMSKSPEYQIWRAAKQRCVNPNDKFYKDYGNRGITFCREWDNFINFYLDMGPRPDKKYFLDRKDNDKGYCKENCRWVTIQESNRNSRNCHMIIFKNQTKTMKEWSEEFNMDYNALADRINRLNWDIEKALTTPIKKLNRKIK